MTEKADEKLVEADDKALGETEEQTAADDNTGKILVTGAMAFDN